MPENARTPSKSSQVAPAHSANHTPRRIDEPIVESKRNLKPDALASEQKFPTLEGLAEEKGLDIEQQASKAITDDINDIGCVSPPGNGPANSPPAAWKGELPAVVKQDAEFTQADTVIIDEPAERAAGLARYKQERKERRAALKTGPFRWFKGEPRETSIERFIVSGASNILGFSLSIVCGFLRIFGLRDLSGRIIMGVRNFADNIVEGTFLRHFRNYGHQWWMYRLPVRMIRNIDRNVRAQIGPEPGKDVEDKVNEVHREANASWETAKKEYSRLRNEANEVIGEAKERLRSQAESAKNK